MLLHRGNVASNRRGAIVVLAALLMVVALGMVACAVDIGYVALVRTQLQRTADAAALAAVAELPVIPGSDGQSAERAHGRAGASRFASYNNAGQTENPVLRSGDVDFFYNANPASYDGSKSYGGGFFNMATVTVRCDSTANQPVALFFAPVLGISETPAMATATAAAQQGGQAVKAGAHLIPFTMPLEVWQALLWGASDTYELTDDKTWDRYSYTVRNGADGVKEAYLFGSEKKTAGNFGSIDLGSDSNGTPDLTRQLLNGINQKDLDQMTEGVVDNVLKVPFTTGGDPGISAGIKSAFDEIIGLPRIMPLYDTVEGNGNNTRYHIVGFAGIVVTEVQLTGNPKYVRVQPGIVYDRNLVPASGDESIPGAGSDTGLYVGPRLVQ